LSSAARTLQLDMHFHCPKHPCVYLSLFSDLLSACLSACLSVSHLSVSVSFSLPFCPSVAFILLHTASLAVGLSHCLDLQAMCRIQTVVTCFCSGSADACCRQKQRHVSRGLISALSIGGHTCGRTRVPGAIFGGVVLVNYGVLVQHRGSPDKHFLSDSFQI
jgi:hypothetical protein